MKAREWKKNKWKCINLYRAHIVQVDNLQQNISKTWINYEPPTHLQLRLGIARPIYPSIRAFDIYTVPAWNHIIPYTIHFSVPTTAAAAHTLMTFVILTDKTFARTHSISIPFYLYDVYYCTISCRLCLTYFTNDCRMKRWKRMRNHTLNIIFVYDSFFLHRTWRG